MGIINVNEIKGKTKNSKNVKIKVTTNFKINWKINSIKEKIIVTRKKNTEREETRFSERY